MNNDTQTAVRIVPVCHRRARVDHHFYRNGVVKRVLVIEDKMLRIALGRPRRTKIDSLDWSGGAATANHSDQWVFAKRAAEALLERLYEDFPKGEREETANVPEPQGNARKRTLGRVIAPIESTDDAIGTLLYAGMRPGIPFCIELLRPDGNLQRIKGIDLPRALAAADATSGDTISVTRVEEHKVDVSAYFSGTHGTGRRMRRRSRLVFSITKAASGDQVDSD